LFICAFDIFLAQVFAPLVFLLFGLCSKKVVDAKLIVKFKCVGSLSDFCYYLCLSHCHPVCLSVSLSVCPLLQNWCVSSRPYRCLSVDCQTVAQLSALGSCNAIRRRPFV